MSSCSSTTLWLFDDISVPDSGCSNLIILSHIPFLYLIMNGNNDNIVLLLFAKDVWYNTGYAGAYL